MLAFVILHYQAIDETKSCIATIKKRVNSEKRIVVVDNCSPNKSGVELREHYEKDDEIKVILLDSNMGFAKGNNIGYRVAKEFEPKYIIVMNNDVFIDCENFESLIDKSYEETSFDILGPDIFSTRDNIHQNPQRIENFTYESLISQHKFLKLKNKFKVLLKIKYMVPFWENMRVVKKNELYDSLKMNVVLHGACYIYSLKYIYSHENCLYNETFMYYESYILHTLANRENLNLVYDPRIKVLHHEDVATDMTFVKKKSKVIFTNKCLFDSCEIFIQVMDNHHIRIG